MRDTDLLLAIDPSTTVVGWCIVTIAGSYLSSGKVNLGDAGNRAKEMFPFPPWRAGSTPMPDIDKHGGAWNRLWALYRWMWHMIYNYGPVPVDCGPVSVIAVEESAGYHGNLATERKLGASMGIVLAAASTAEIGMIRIKPMQVKATGYSKKNAESMRAAALFAGKESVSRDEADAIGVAMAAVKKLREREWIGG